MQDAFFPGLRGINYCHCRTQCREFLVYVLRTDDLEFNADYARKLFDESVALNESDTVVLSDEMFYAPMTWSGHVHRQRGCDRLAAVFPEGRVAIVLRNQRELLESLYREFIQNGGTASWPNFLKKHVAAGYLHFGSYVMHLKERFGASGLNVFLYEDFVLRPEEYLDSWCDVLGVGRGGWDRGITEIRSNPTVASGLLPILRAANRVVSSKRHPELLVSRAFHKWLTAVLLKLSPRVNGSSRSLCPDNAALRNLLDDCRPGNREISRYLGRDLDTMGYPC